MSTLKKSHLAAHFALSLFGTIFNHSAFAADSPILCKNYGVRSLSYLTSSQAKLWDKELDEIKTQPPRPIEVIDLCTHPDAAPNGKLRAEGIKAFLSSVRDIQTRESAILNGSFEEFLPDGIDITLVEDPLGEVGSDTGGIQTSLTGPVSHFNQINFHVYGSFDGMSFSRSVYAHELGHVLSVSPEVDARFKFLQDYAENSRDFYEGFADFMAWLTVGTLKDGDSFYSCANQGRDPSDGLDYGKPIGSFDRYFSTRIFLQCAAERCHFGQQETQNDELCSILSTSRDMLASIPFNPSPFDPHFKAYDPHMTFTPFIVFFSTLRQRIPGFDVGKSLSRWLSAASTKAYRTVGDRKVPSLKAFFSIVRESLSQADQVVVDEAWKSKKLDLGIEYFENKEPSFR